MRNAIVERQFPMAVDNLPRPEIRPLSWFHQRLLAMGILSMSNAQPQQPGFYVNWTSLSAIVVIVGSIAGLWYFTWNTAQNQGYEKGKAEAEKIQMQHQIDEAKTAAGKAKDIALGTQSDQPEQEKKKK